MSDEVLEIGRAVDPLEDATSVAVVQEIKDMDTIKKEHAEKKGIKRAATMTTEVAPIDLSEFDELGYEEDEDEFNPETGNPMTHVFAGVEDSPLKREIRSQLVRFLDSTGKAIYKLDNTNVDFGTGQIKSIVIDGMKFYNREKLKQVTNLRRPRKGLSVEYGQKDLDRKKTTVVCISESGFPFSMEYPGYLNVNKVRSISWGGYSFWHQAWLRHEGWLHPRLTDKPTEKDFARHSA